MAQYTGMVACGVKLRAILSYNIYQYLNRQTIMIDPNKIIEDHQGPELAVFEHEVEQLTQQQLEQLNVEEGIYTQDRAQRVHRDLLEISAAEVRWPKYFAAYRKVVGRPSILDPDQDQ